MHDFDEDLIRALQLDGRAQFSTLADQLGVHRTVVAKRVQELIDTGEISIRGAIHPSALGMPVQVNLRLRILGPTTPIFETLLTRNDVVFLSEITGPEQGIVELWAPDLATAARSTREIRAIPGVLEVQMSLYEHVVRRLRLSQDPRVPDLTFDDFDIQLMGLLQENGRYTFGELSRALGRSASACRTRVLRLLETNAIRIGAVRTRRAATSSLLAGVGITLSGSETTTEAFEQLFVELPGIEFIARTMGSYSFIATISARSIPHFTQLVRDIRAQPGVMTVDTWVHAHIWAESYEWRLDRLLGGQSIVAGGSLASETRNSSHGRPIDPVEFEWQD